MYRGYIYIYIGYVRRYSAFGSYPCNLSKDDDGKEVCRCALFFINFRLLLLADGL